MDNLLGSVTLYQKYYNGFVQVKKMMVHLSSTQHASGTVFIEEQIKPIIIMYYIRTTRDKPEGKYSWARRTSRWFV